MKLLIFLLDPTRQWKILPIVIAFFYGVIPLVQYTFAPSSYLLTCASAAGVSVVAMYLGGAFAKRKKALLLPAPSQQRPNSILVTVTGLAFISFVIVVVLTAPSIPIFTALSGGSRDVISEGRADFLKSRSGWQAVLVYLNALFSGFFCPYLLVKLYYVRSRKFLPFLVVFASYSILSTEKAFFIRWALPLLVLFLMLGTNGNNKHIRMARLLFVGSAVLVLLNIALTGFTGDGSVLNAFQGISLGDFFNAKFYASMSSKGSAFIFFIWRVFAVPTFTAVDSIKTFQEDFGGQFLLGATNGTLATIFDLPRVWFERAVFNEQWGQAPDGTNSSNAVYFIEAYVNFGWAGIIIFSLLVGYVLARMGRSRDVGIVALTPLLAYNLNSSGVLGTLLGNGLFLLPVVSWLHVKKRSVVSKGML